jgi:hypothetical protein
MQQGSPPDLAQIALRLKEDAPAGSALMESQVTMHGNKIVHDSWHLDQFFSSLDMTFDGTFA